MKIKKTKEILNGKHIVYHGSSAPNLTQITPNKCKHEKAYVYVCENIALSVVFAVKRVSEGINFGIGSLGMPFIEELYDGAFEDRFRNKTCYIYKLDKSLFNDSTHNAQELVCENQVDVLGYIKIDDAAEFLLEQAKKKQIKILLYENLSEKKKIEARNKLKKALRQYLGFKMLDEKHFKALTQHEKASYEWKKQRRDNAYKYFPQIMQELEKEQKDENKLM